MTLSYRKSIAGALAAATLIGSIGVASEANAAWRGGRGGRVGAGIVGGLALGALAAGAAGSYYGPGYYGRGYAECRRERQPVYDRFGGFRGYRIVRVCD